MRIQARSLYRALLPSTGHPQDCKIYDLGPTQAILLLASELVIFEAFLHIFPQHTHTHKHTHVRAHAHTRTHEPTPQDPQSSNSRRAETWCPPICASCISDNCCVRKKVSELRVLQLLMGTLYVQVLNGDRGLGALSLYPPGEKQGSPGKSLS